MRSNVVVMFFWSFLTKTRQDRALPSHFDGEFLPHNTQFCCQNIYSETYGPTVLNRQQNIYSEKNDELCQRSENQYHKSNLSKGETVFYSERIKE